MTNERDCSMSTIKPCKQPHCKQHKHLFVGIGSCLYAPQYEEELIGECLAPPRIGVGWLSSICSHSFHSPTFVILITTMKPLNHRRDVHSLRHAFVVVLMVISIGILVIGPLDGVDAALTHKISILPRDDIVDLDTSASATAAAPCKCGYEPKNGVPGNTCVACAPGSYSSGTKCLPCLAATIAPSSGSCSCQPCGAGTQSSPNATSCELCPLGTYSNDNNLCKQCPDGSISTTAGATSCKQCSTLLSQSCGVGSTQGVSCRLCPIGTYGPSATSGCINCPAVRGAAVNLRAPARSPTSSLVTLNREQQRQASGNAHALHAPMDNAYANQDSTATPVGCARAVLQEPSRRTRVHRRRVSHAVVARNPTATTPCASLASQAPSLPMVACARHAQSARSVPARELVSVIPVAPAPKRTPRNQDASFAILASTRHRAAFANHVQLAPSLRTREQHFAINAAAASRPTRHRLDVESAHLASLLVLVKAVGNARSTASRAMALASATCAKQALNPTPRNQDASFAILASTRHRAVLVNNVQLAPSLRTREQHFANNAAAASRPTRHRLDVESAHLASLLVLVKAVGNARSTASRAMALASATCAKQALNPTPRNQDASFAILASTRHRAVLVNNVQLAPSLRTREQHFANNAAAASRPTRHRLDVESAHLASLLVLVKAVGNARSTASRAMALASATCAKQALNPTPRNQDASFAILASTRLTVGHADHVPMAWFRR